MASSIHLRGGGAPTALTATRPHPLDNAVCAHGIRERGDTPFLHAAADHTSAIRLYESLGLTLRRRSTILLVRTPGTPGEAGAL